MFKRYFRKFIGWVIGMVIIGIIVVVLYAKYGA